MTPHPQRSDSDFEPSRGYSTWVLGLLLVVYIVNFVDRQVMAIVAVDIKRELGLSDRELGFLLGPVFAIFYTLAGVPIARLADLTSRRGVIAAGVALWSAMTIACGLARSYSTLLAARLLVGVGEAAGTPPSHSLISDYFAPERRATALAIYGVGIYFGVMFGFLAGGYVRDAFDWRTAFIVAGLPGLPLALLVRFTIREPPAGASERGPVSTDTPTTADVVRELFGRPVFVWLLVAACFQALLGYAVLAWGAVFLIRVHEMTATDIGLTFGVIAGLAGALGTTSGGYLADRLAERDQRWYVWLAAAVSLAAFPFAVGFLLAPERALALGLFAPFYVLNNMYVGPLWSMTQNLVQPRARAVASATLLAVLNLVGLGLGPFLVGELNEALAPRFGDEAVRWSLLCMAGLGACSAPFFLLCGRALRLSASSPPSRP